MNDYRCSTYNNSYSTNLSLHLKRITQNDVPEFWQLVDRNRVHLARWIPWVQYMLSFEDAQEFIEHQVIRSAETGSIRVGVWCDQQLVACITLYHPLKMHVEQQMNMGYWLDQHYQGRGIMTWAARALIEQQFDLRRCTCVRIVCHKDNHSSIAVVRRLKFKAIPQVSDDTDVSDPHRHFVMTVARWRHLYR